LDSVAEETPKHIVWRLLGFAALVQRFNGEPNQLTTKLIIYPFIGTALVVLAGSQSVANAASIAFSAQAQITSIVSGFGADPVLPVNLSVGDTITATFAFDDAAPGVFDPSTFWTNYQEEHAFRFMLNGVALESPSYLLQFLDNSPYEDPTDYGDVGPHGPSDGLEIQVVQSPGAPVSFWQAFIALAGESHILNSNEVTEDVAVWNKFTYRLLTFGFSNSGGNKFTFVQANLGIFKVVPEPSTAALLVIGCVVALVVRRR
jgi:hypothetical protein